MKNRLIMLLTGLVLLAALITGCAGGTQTLAPGQIVEVKRGDISIDVTSDGNLEMPNEYDLKFGTQGQVTDVFVTEGDFVHAGSLLALQDESTQIDAIKQALFSIQTAQNNITLGCAPDHLPYNYPDLSIARMADEAESDIAKAVAYFQQGDYKSAGYWLVMTYYDLEVCEDLINTRPNAAVLAGAKTNSIWTPDPYAGSSQPMQADYTAVIAYLDSYRQSLLNVSHDMTGGDYKKIGAELAAAASQVAIASEEARSTINIKSRMIFEYADTPSTADFLQSSLRAVQDLQSYIDTSDASPVEAAKRLYIGKLNLQVAHDVLQTQTLIFETGTGINWQTLQQYNLSLQNAEVGLYTAKQNVMQNAIIAPANGAIVQVNAKISTVTSAQTYSASTAVILVDTSYVRFNGQIDEIDITKVKAGQKVNLTVDAIPDKAFTGTVQFISPYGVATGQVIKFNILIALDPTDVPLRGGLSATANINAAKATNVLLVPVSVLVSTPGGYFVTVMDSAGKPERKPVTVGLQNFQYAEVKSGLNEGDKVQVVTAQSISTAAPAGATRPGPPMIPR